MISAILFFRQDTLFCETKRVNVCANVKGMQMHKAIDKQTGIGAMSAQEKVSLLSGMDFWCTKAVQRLGIEPYMMTDGPHGMRKQAGSSAESGFTANVPASCFPTGAGLAATWNPKLVERMGAAMGAEARAENVGILLGPAVNIKRSPLCGRNFEYYSEDPLVAGKIAAAHIRGIQSQGVGTSIKHFAVNNQEFFRMVVDAIVDERTLREIYLRAFEIAIKEAAPWTVMCAYNRVNGVYCSENPHLLTEILRDEWRFDGVLVTDWIACNDRVAGLVAGQDLEMPGNGGVNDRRVLDALESGRLDERFVDRALERLLLLYNRVKAAADDKRPVIDFDAHHDLTRSVAAESVVLLKNEGLLPLAKDTKITLVGAFAQKPRYQGGGSSHINPTRMDTLHEMLSERFDHVRYAMGYDLAGDIPDQKLIDEACTMSAGADVVVVCAGLIDTYESEGFDRSHMRMPQSHTALIEALCGVHKRVVVVLSNGSPVEMPWIQGSGAVVEAYLAGQGGAHAIAAILAGEINPSGKLAESFPLRLEDTPCYLHFPGTPERVEYREGVFVGYRHYDSVQAEVLFPFGHGLSYTSFDYSDLMLKVNETPSGPEVEVTLSLRNSGQREGRETVQLYVRECAPPVPRPWQELKAFDKIELYPGETKALSFSLDSRAFAWYDATSGDWRLSGGDYEIRVGASSRDIRLVASLQLAAFPAQTSRSWGPTDTLYEIRKYPQHRSLADKILDKYIEIFAGSAEPGSPEALMFEAMFREMPLRGLAQFGGIEGAAMLESILAQLNG